MTLREYLTEKDDGTLIKVGANDGSSFFYCGTAGEFLANIEAIDEGLRDKTKNAMKVLRREFLKSMQGFSYSENGETMAARNAETKTETTAENDMSFTAWTEQKIKESTEGLRRAYNEWLAGVGQKQADAIAAEKLMREEKSVLEREVITVFAADAIVEPELTLCVLIFGWENGQYWTMDEVKAEKAKSKK